MYNFQKLLCELPEHSNYAFHVRSERKLNSTKGFRLHICFEYLLASMLVSSVYRPTQKEVPVGPSDAAVTVGMWAWCVASVSVW